MKVSTNRERRDSRISTDFNRAQVRNPLHCSTLCPKRHILDTVTEKMCTKKKTENLLLDTDFYDEH